MAIPAAFSSDSDLSGLWSGEYWYARAGFPTPFTAHIIDMSGALDGTTLEPNTFRSASGAELSATLTGSRFDLSVEFIKLYDPAPGVHRTPIRYQGSVDVGLTLIEGEWAFPGGEQHIGRFVLARIVRKGEAAVLETAAVAGARGRR